MVPNGIDIVKILTAAAPIVASVADIVTKNNKEKELKALAENQPAKNVSVTINNNFYTNSPKESSLAFEMSKQTNTEQIVNAILSSDTHYNI